jgi:hypothetical protein
MSFNVHLEHVRTSTSGDKPEQLQLLPFMQALSTHPSSCVKSFGVPVNTRLQLVITKAEQPEEELSGRISVIRVNHISDSCKSYWHHTPHMALGVTEGAPNNKLSFCEYGMFLYGKRLNEIQLALPLGGMHTTFCTCPCTLYVNGLLNGAEIEAALRVKLVPGVVLEYINPLIIETSSCNIFSTTSFPLIYCRCENCETLDERLNSRELYLYDIAKNG